VECSGRESARLFKAVDLKKGQYGFILILETRLDLDLSMTGCATQLDAPVPAGAQDFARPVHLYVECRQLSQTDTVCMPYECSTDGNA
jgi:hypothetical protein